MAQVSQITVTSDFIGNFISKFVKRKLIFFLSSSGKLVLFELVFLLMVLRLSCSETDYSLEIDQDTLMIFFSVLHFLELSNRIRGCAFMIKRKEYICEK